jgi:hypothetical protein
MSVRSLFGTIFLALLALSAVESAQPVSIDDGVPEPRELQTWTDANGRSIRATLVSVAGDRVVLKRDDRKQCTIATNRLSPKDRLLIVRMQDAQPALPAPRRVEEALKILNEPEVKQTEEKLIQENIRSERRIRTRTIHRYIEELYWQQYCYRGRICYRLCRRLVPVFESVEELYEVQVPTLQAQTILDSPQDSRVGTGLRTIQLSTLPAAAGGRASKIFSASQQLLPISIVESTSVVDRTLVAESTDFTEQGSNPANEEKVKLVANVRGNDKQIDIIVLLAIRDKASGILSTDTAALDQLAQQLADQIAQELP